jgi:hypothetical protein
MPIYIYLTMFPARDTARHNIMQIMFCKIYSFYASDTILNTNIIRSICSSFVTNRRR